MQYKLLGKNTFFNAWCSKRQRMPAQSTVDIHAAVIWWRFSISPPEMKTVSTQCLLIGVEFPFFHISKDVTLHGGLKYPSLIKGFFRCGCLRAADTANIPVGCCFAGDKQPGQIWSLERVGSDRSAHSLENVPRKAEATPGLQQLARVFAIQLQVLNGADDLRVHISEHVTRQERRKRTEFKWKGE